MPIVSTATEGEPPVGGRSPRRPAQLEEATFRLLDRGVPTIPGSRGRVLHRRAGARHAWHASLWNDGSRMRSDSKPTSPLCGPGVWSIPSGSWRPWPSTRASASGSGSAGGFFVRGRPARGCVCDRSRRWQRRPRTGSLRRWICSAADQGGHGRVGRRVFSRRRGVFFTDEQRAVHREALVASIRALPRRPYRALVAIRANVPGISVSAARASPGGSRGVRRQKPATPYDGGSGPATPVPPVLIRRTCVGATSGKEEAFMLFWTLAIFLMIF